MASATLTSFLYDTYINSSDNFYISMAALYQDILE